MDQNEYSELTTGALDPDDLAARGLMIHQPLMVAISKFRGESKEELMRIARMVDVLMGSVIIQHLEMAKQNPHRIEEAIELLRPLVEEKVSKFKGLI